MYNHGKKLSELTMSKRYTNEEIKGVFARMSQCFLTSLNSLSLLSIEQAFFVVPKTRRNAFDDSPEDDFDAESEIVDCTAIRKAYYDALGKLTLFGTNSHLGQSFQLPDHEDIFSIYCSNNQFDMAIQMANLNNLKLDKVIKNCVKVIVQILHGRPWYSTLIQCV
jgi:hypothetical protein